MFNYKKVIKKILKKLLIVLAVFLIILFFIFGLLSNEARRKTIIEKIGWRYYYPIKSFSLRVLDIPFIFTPGMYHSTEIDKIYINVNADDFKDMSKLNPDNDIKDVNGEMIWGEWSNEIKIGSKGGSQLHWLNEKKSWKIEIKEGDYPYGMKGFRLILPEDRGFINEMYSYYWADKIGLVTPSNRLVDLFINNKRAGFYLLIEDFDKAMLEKQGLSGDSDFYGDDSITPSFYESLFNFEKYTNDIDGLGRDDYTYLAEFLEIINDEDDESFYENIFLFLDKDSFLKWQVHSVLVGSTHQDDWHNVRLYYDKSKGKLILMPWDVSILEGPQYNLDLKYNNFVSRILKNPVYLEERNALLYKYVKDESLWTEALDYYESLMAVSKNSIIQDKNKMITSFDFFAGIEKYYEFNKDQRNRLMAEMEKKQAEILITETDNQYIFSFTNKGFNPFYANEITVEYGDKAAMPEDKRVFLSDENGNKISCALECDEDKTKCSLAVDNLWKVYSYRDDDVEYYEELEIDKRETNYRLLGDLGEYEDIKIDLIDTVTNEEFDKREKDVRFIRKVDQVDLDVIKAEKVTGDDGSFKYDDEVIILKPGNYYFKKDLIVPINKKLIVEAGAVLNFAKGVGLLSYSPIEANGTSDKPITFNLNGGNVVIIEADFQSTFENCYFSGGGEKKLNGTYVSGMLSSYYSDMYVNNCLFKDARGDDGLNVKNARTVIKNNVFVANGFDALDLDYVTADSVVERNYFKNSGNDSIDVSGSDLKIQFNTISGSGDKGISLGEESSPLVYSNFIENCVMGIAIKDSSSLYLVNNTLFNNEFGLNFYRKKDFFNGGRASIYNNVFWHNDKDIELDGYSQIDSCNNNLINNEFCADSFSAAELDFTENGILSADFESELLLAGNKEYLPEGIRGLFASIPLGRID